MSISKIQYYHHNGNAGFFFFFQTQTYDKGHSFITITKKRSVRRQIADNKEK